MSLDGKQAASSLYNFDGSKTISQMYTLYKAQNGVPRAMKELDLVIRSRDTKWLQKKVVSSSQATEVCRLFFHEDIELYESFFLLMLNQNAQVVSYVKISQGGITGTVVDPILVAKYAIDSLAKFVILCHNHPSGSLTPSEADNKITDQVKKGLNLFGISVRDHIIITKDSYFSFADHAIL